MPNGGHIDPPGPPTSLYLRNFRAKVFEEANGAALEAALNAWFLERGEEVVINMYAANIADSFVIIYTE